MPKSYETLMGTETTIRWDETGEPAVLYTASNRVKREWASFGFPIEEICTGNRLTGWRTHVPIDRISYKPLKKQAQKRTDFAV